MSIHVNLLYVNFLISTALPVLTALITHQKATARYKALILVGFSVIAGVGNALIQGGGNFSFNQAGIWAVITFAFAAIMHQGLLKPLGITGTAGLVAVKFPRGLGKPAALPAGSSRLPTSLA